MEKGSSPKNFLEITKRIEHLQQKHLRQTLFLRLQLRTSLVIELIEYFLLYLNTITTCFEHDIFHNNLKGNVKRCRKNACSGVLF